MPKKEPKFDCESMETEKVYDLEKLYNVLPVYLFYGVPRTFESYIDESRDDYSRTYIKRKGIHRAYININIEKIEKDDVFTTVEKNNIMSKRKIKFANDNIYICLKPISKCSKTYYIYDIDDYYHRLIVEVADPDKIITRRELKYFLRVKMYPRLSHFKISKMKK